jgi:hypothetical protein
MHRALRILTLALAAGAAVYMAATFGSSPDRMPMQWDIQNRPTWFAPKAAFYGMFAGILLLGLALSFVRPASAVGGAIVFTVGLLLPVCRGAATGSPILSVTTATLIVLLVSFAAAGVTVVQALKAANSRGAGGPPPAPPRGS